MQSHRRSRKLIIVSGSSKVHKEPPIPIPAIERFSGVFAGQIRKYYDKLDHVDVLFLSCTYGLIRAEQKITPDITLGSGWIRPIESCSNIDKSKEKNAKILADILSTENYDEVYVNVGKDMLALLPNLEQTLPQGTKLTFSQGRGIGPKMAHMKKWIERRIL